MFFLGCHLIDVILQVCGTPKEVISLNCSAGKDNVNTDVFGMVVLKYENGVSFAKVNTTEISGFSRRLIVVCGTEGTVEIHPIEESVAGIMYGTTAYKRENNEIKYYGCKDKERVKSNVFTRYGNMLKSFAEYVRK